MSVSHISKVLLFYTSHLDFDLISVCFVQGPPGASGPTGPVGPAGDKVA